jgi:hypothetical protein
MITTSDYELILKALSQSDDSTFTLYTLKMINREELKTMWDINELIRKHARKQHRKYLIDQDRYGNE